MGYSYTFKEREINFLDETRINYWDFLLSEFFNATDDEKIQILKDYKSRFGISSYNYMLSNYWYSWQQGSRNISNVQADRICSIMPLLLNETARHKLGVNDFMLGIQHTVRSFLHNQKIAFRNAVSIKNPQEVAQIFEKEFEKIKGTSIENFRFGVLSNEEKHEALEIAHYILETKLQKSFDQIERDFSVFLPYMFKFKRGIFSAKYSITTFKLNVDITNAGIQDVEIPKFRIKEIEANSRFKEYSDKYLAYELVSIHQEANKAVSNSFLNANDIQLFFEHYEELSKGESEVSMNSTFQGEGGILVLKAQMKPLKLLRTSIIISSVKLAIYTIVFVTLLSLAINQKLFALLIFGGYFVGALAFSLVSKECKQLKSLTKEYKKYGQ